MYENKLLVFNNIQILTGAEVNTRAEGPRVTLHNWGAKFFSVDRG